MCTLLPFPFSSVPTAAVFNNGIFYTLLLADDFHTELQYLCFALLKLC